MVSAVMGFIQITSKYARKIFLFQKIYVNLVPWLLISYIKALILLVNDAPTNVTDQKKISGKHKRH